MLNSARYQGCTYRTLNVHCTQTPAMPTSIACSAPSSTSAMNATAYDGDSVDPQLSGSGSVTFQREVMHEASTSVRNTAGRGSAVGKDAISRMVPSAMTAPI